MTAPACREVEPLLAERAAGDLAAPDAARLDVHLACCAACRAEAAAYADALALARLPEPTAAERAALAGVGDRALATLRAEDRGRASFRRLSVAVGVAAAAAGFLLAPAAFRDRRPPFSPATSGEEATAAAEWQAPDPAALWEEAGVAYGGATAIAAAGTAAGTAPRATASATTAEETWSDAALAAFDDVEGLATSE